MATTKFKYNINHIISYQPQWMSVERISGYLEKAGIPMRTFFRDKSIKADEREDIPGERLLIYSKFFEVPMVELFNYTRKVKTLSSHGEPTESMAKMMKRTGLKLPNR